MALEDRTSKSRKVHSDNPRPEKRNGGKLHGAVCFHHTALRLQGLPGPVQVQRYAPASALARY
jgi:hypothetical protein